MSKQPYVTRIDGERLNHLIDEALFSGAAQDNAFAALRSELSRASVVEPQKLPPGAISMRSRALIALDGEEEEVSLVYPEEADWTVGKLSVLSPIGTALLGYCEGDQLDWDVAGGKTHIEIRRLLYQPEAAGDYDL